MPSDAARWAGRVSGTLDIVYRWLEPAQQRRDRQKRSEPLGLLAFYAHDSIYNFHVAKRFYTTERKVQIQSTCIFPAWATNNPAEEIMVSSCTPPINPLPPRQPQLLQHPSFQEKSLTCEDLPGYETWAEGKNIGVLIWASGAGYRARIRPSGCGQKRYQSQAGTSA